VTGSARDVAVPTRGTALDSDDTAELKRLFDALPDALKVASTLLHETSTSSPAYVAADAEVARIISRIDTLLNG
jgi:hypothetical protein